MTDHHRHGRITQSVLRCKESDHWPAGNLPAVAITTTHRCESPRSMAVAGKCSSTGRRPASRATRGRRRPHGLATTSGRPKTIGHPMTVSSAAAVTSTSGAEVDGDASAFICSPLSERDLIDLVGEFVGLREHLGGRERSPGSRTVRSHAAALLVDADGQRQGPHRRRCRAVEPNRSASSCRSSCR